MPITPDTGIDDADVSEGDEPETIRGMIEEHPLAALAAAVVFGFMLARIVF